MVSKNESIRIIAVLEEGKACARKGRGGESFEEKKKKALK